jgi:hypothetical protein
VVQVIAMVTDNRKNGPEPIEVMTKISDTRGYGSTLERKGKVEAFDGDAFA